MKRDKSKWPDTCPCKGCLVLKSGSNSRFSSVYFHNDDWRSYFFAELSEQAMKEGKFDDALRLAKQCSQANARDALFALLTKALACAKRTDQAVKLLSEIRNQRDFWEAGTNLIDASIAHGDVDTACSVFYSSVKKIRINNCDPENIDNIRFRVANAYAESGDFKKGRKIIKGAFSGNERDSALHEMADIALGQKNYLEAILCAEAIVSDGGHSGWVIYEIAEILHKEPDRSLAKKQTQSIAREEWREMALAVIDGTWQGSIPAPFDAIYF